MEYHTVTPKTETLEPTDGWIGNLIFLSYRRTDTAAQTLALKLELETQLRAAQIFMDTQDVKAGDVWRQQIENALSAANTEFLKL
jgi:hypothetical protein